MCECPLDYVTAMGAKCVLCVIPRGRSSWVTGWLRHACRDSEHGECRMCGCEGVAVRLSVQLNCSTNRSCWCVIVEARGISNIVSDYDTIWHGQVFCKTNRRYMCGILVYTAVEINAVAFWVMQLCRLLAGHQPYSEDEGGMFFQDIGTTWCRNTKGHCV
jgi:hypothetical protein